MSKLAKVDPLTSDERRVLRCCKKAVQAAMNNLMEAAPLLREVKEKRLYREGYASFEEFCRAEFSMDRTHAYRLIAAANVVEAIDEARSKARYGQPDTGEDVALGDTVLPLPTNERQARPLAQLPAADQPKAWKKAVNMAGGKQPTGKQVAAAVKIVSAPPSPPAKAPKEPSPLSLAMPALEVIRRLSAGNHNEKAALELIINEAQERLS
ncbi:hypothetical protein OpiT1DRAFT_03992 [Opitutaceae bacterium TAV1]|nr:hypothetical protein OpiT1DRAFT_03992 [Opitutaceae bacterium TAV1]